MPTMTALGDALAKLAKAGETAATLETAKPQHPNGWEPGVVWNGREGAVTSKPMTERPQSWDDLLAIWDLDPQQYEVMEPVQFRAWDAAIGNGETQRMFYYKATIRQRRANGHSIEDLLAVINAHKPRKTTKTEGDHAWVWAVGDTQIGKPDGDGSEGTVTRFLNALDYQVEHFKKVAKRRSIGSIYLPWLGDCIEGTVSQGGSLAAAGRLDLTLTEQVRIVRRLMLAQVQAFAPLVDRLVVPVIPGNHDEAERKGSIVRRYDDSWAIEAASAVADACALSDKFSNVSFVFPQPDELTLTLDIAGTITGLAHGHQYRGGPEKAHGWWAGQSHGMQPIGDATLLLVAHRHHLFVQTAGAKTVIQMPAMDGGSTWWRHSTGQHADAATVSLVIGQGGWSDMDVKTA